MYHFDDSVVGEQMSLLIQCAQSYALFRVVSELSEFEGVGKEYWVHLNDLAYNDILIKWCIVFGADNNEIHWKKASTTDGFIPMVRNKILTLFGGDLQRWKECRDNMCSFRNSYSSHRNTSEFQPAPYLDLPMKVAELYFNILVDEIGSWSGHQPYLAEYIEQHKERCLRQKRT
ncbi:TPA: hypothetical protein NKT21_004592 [Vibrio parahaemolyticus]|nr:hypothetical protein [Vibrio parahaemolyticus]